MNAAKCSIELYTNFLIASQKQYSGVELSRVAPEEMSHDAVSGYLAREKLTPKLVWEYAETMVEKRKGYLSFDDSILDKPYAREIPLVHKQYSGKHHRIVPGICLVNAVWSDGEKIVPIDFRIFDREKDGKTKNDHFLEMLDIAEVRGMKPQYVLLDAWYTSLENLKAVDRKEWKWIGGIKLNRLVSLEKGIYLSVATLDWTAAPVHKAWLKGYGLVLVSKLVTTNGDITYIATNDLSLMNFEELKDHYTARWTVETFHRGVKQCCGIERCSSRRERSQRNHILCSILAFLKLELRRFSTSLSWYQQKWNIPRIAVTNYLATA